MAKLQVSVVQDIVFMFEKVWDQFFGVRVSMRLSHHLLLILTEPSNIRLQCFGAWWELSKFVVNLLWEIQVNFAKIACFCIVRCLQDGAQERF